MEIKVEDRTYNIVDEFEATDLEGHNEFEVKETDQKKSEEIFTYLPLWIDGKFRWLRKTTIEKTLFLQRKKDMNMDYIPFWTKWKEKWKITKILK